jgi:hypothetical protein
LLLHEIAFHFYAAYNGSVGISRLAKLFGKIAEAAPVTFDKLDWLISSHTPPNRFLKKIGKVVKTDHPRGAGYDRLTTNGAVAPRALHLRPQCVTPALGSFH